MQSIRNIIYTVVFLITGSLFGAAFGMVSGSIPGRTGEAGYLILTSDDLLPAAEIISTLHSQEVPEADRLNTEIVSIDTLVSGVYGGYPTEMVIRAYLLDRIANTPELRFLLLLGDENDLPPIYTLGGDSPSDDFYTSAVEYTAIPQLATGRIPVHNLEDALQYTDKLRDYILTPVPGNWRDKIMLLADDTNKSSNNILIEMTHVAYSNALYLTLRDQFDVQTIYGTEYTPQPGPGWLLQPDMTADALATINSGVAMLNYIGHGSPTTLADEKIIDMDRDLQQIHDPVNAIWVVGTCKFGWYDGKDAMSEALLLKPDGAIALVAASRDIQPSSNYSYLDNFFGTIQEFVNNENDFRIGELVSFIKNDGPYEHLFHLLGDPAMRLPFPRMTTIIDLPASSDTLRILEPMEIQLTQTYAQFNNYLIIKGPEKDIMRGFPENNPTDFLFYKLPGDIIYQGFMSDQAQIIIPIDIQFCDTCTGSISVYSDRVNDSLESELTTVVDNWASIPIAESSAEISDNTGPVITVSSSDAIVRPGGVLFPPYELDIVFTDESGINLMDAMGHGLRYWLDDQPESTSLIPFFEYYSATDGHTGLSLAIVEPGYHDLIIEAWDNVNNKTQSTFELYFSGAGQFTAEKIFNYPNPFKEDTYFTFTLSEPATVSISVFSIGGQKIVTLSAGSLESGYHAIYWNGKDQSSSTIANGAYFYRLKAVSPGGEVFETINKLARIK
ncbi:MAG: T9SS type A sorting domain-containing protein [FCB group bacterium]|nr:T9SS type A sorting domain-containing protein [FCB group bacterium]